MSRTNDEFSIDDHSWYSARANWLFGMSLGYEVLVICHLGRLLCVCGVLIESCDPLVSKAAMCRINSDRWLPASASAYNFAVLWPAVRKGFKA